LPRVLLPSAGCFICLRVLGKTLSKQLQQQQPVDFPLSEPDQRQRSLMKRRTAAAGHGAGAADSHVTLDFPGDDR